MYLNLHYPTQQNLDYQQTMPPLDRGRPAPEPERGPPGGNPCATYSLEVPADVPQPPRGAPLPDPAEPRLPTKPNPYAIPGSYWKSCRLAGHVEPQAKQQDFTPILMSSTIYARELHPQEGGHPEEETVACEKRGEKDSESEACENGDQLGLRSNSGEEPEVSDDEQAVPDAAASRAAAPPLPEGPPPTLSEQQRARLHQLLQQRDDQGRVPYGVDELPTDAARWQAYRQALKSSYRQFRKRQRVVGAWDKDYYRGRGPRCEPQERRDRRSRSRSPLPRRRHVPR